MNFSIKSMGITALGSVVVGFCLGFIPEYVAKSHVEARVAKLNDQNAAAEKSLNDMARQLKLNDLALQAAVLSADADKSNYADASKEASALFTGLRRYLDIEHDELSKPAIEEVLAKRDATVASLAKADPSVRPVLAQMFQKLKALGARAES